MPRFEAAFTTPSPSEGAFARSYCRGNKKGGVKNLKTFPVCCCVQHKKGSQCHAPVVLSFRSLGGTEMRSDSIVALARFRTHGGGAEKSEAALECVVDRMYPRASLKPYLRSPESPLAPVMVGRVQAVKFGEVEVTFDEKCWHYGWTGGRYKTGQEHVFEVAFFEAVGGNELCCLHVIASSGFTVYSSRRASPTDKIRRRIANKLKREAEQDHLAQRQMPQSNCNEGSQVSLDAAAASVNVDRPRGPLKRLTHSWRHTSGRGFGTKKHFKEGDNDQVPKLPWQAGDEFSPLAKSAAESTRANMDRPLKTPPNIDKFAAQTSTLSSMSSTGSLLAELALEEVVLETPSKGQAAAATTSNNGTTTQMGPKPPGVATEMLSAAPDSGHSITSKDWAAVALELDRSSRSIDEGETSSKGVVKMDIEPTHVSFGLCRADSMGRTSVGSDRLHIHSIDSAEYLQSVQVASAAQSAASLKKGYEQVMSGGRNVSLNGRRKSMRWKACLCCTCCDTD